MHNCRHCVCADDNVGMLFKIAVTGAFLRRACRRGPIPAPSMRALAASCFDFGTVYAQLFLFCLCIWLVWSPLPLLPPPAPPVPAVAYDAIAHAGFQQDEGLSEDSPVLSGYLVLDRS